MADHGTPQITTHYATLLALLHERMTDLAKALDGVGTNLPVGAVRWDGGAKKWKKWSGSAWVDLADVFDIKNTASNTNCNAVMGKTNVQAALNALAGTIPSGTRMLFQQSTAPTGWTKVTDHNDKALRVVSGTASYGGSVAFSSAMSARTVSNTTVTGAVGGASLSAAMLASHAHVQMINGYGAYNLATSYITNGEAAAVHSSSVATAGEGWGHQHGHPFSTNAHNHTLDMAINYVDVIIASKN